MSYHGWLQQVVTPVQPYKHHYWNRTFMDVDTCLRYYPTLRPRTDHFNRIAGRPVQLLICVSGTLPVLSIQNGNRQIPVPIEIWFPLQYPLSAPLVFVNPAILEPQHGLVLRGTSVCRVEDGHVLHPYQQYWTARPGANVVELVSLLQAAFGQELPIVSSIVQQQHQQQQHNNNNNNAVVNELGRNMSGAAYSMNSMQPMIDEFLKRLALKAQISAAINHHQPKDNPAEDTITLNEGYQKIQQELVALEAELSKVTEEQDRLRAKHATLEHQLDNKSDRSEELVFAVNEDGSRQIVEVMAAEAALSDAIYAVNKQLTRMSTDESTAFVTSYLRMIRELGRRQFMQKALLKKLVSNK